MYTLRSIRRSDQPSRPSARTCCFFSSLKTFTAGGYTSAIVNVWFHIPLAAFQVSTDGRFWVSPEVHLTLCRAGAKTEVSYSRCISERGQSGTGYFEARLSHKGQQYENGTLRSPHSLG